MNEQNQNTNNQENGTVLGQVGMPVGPNPNPNLGVPPVASPSQGETPGVNDSVNQPLPTPPSLGQEETLAAPGVLDGASNQAQAMGPNPTPGIVGSSNPTPNLNPTPNPQAYVNPNLNPSNNNPLGTDPINNIDVNNFGDNNKTDNIGVTPPNKENKKGMNKIVFIILIVVLIGGVAYGIYTVLNMSNKPSSKVSIRINNNPLVIPYGSEISKDVTTYATVSGIDVSKCVIENINGINSTVPGTYNYKVVCGNNPSSSVSESGVIIVSEPEDLEKPIMIVKPVYHVLGETTTLNPNDFVESCLDGEEACQTVEITNIDELNTKLDTLGTYSAQIKATDAKGNETTAQVPLYVISSSILQYLNCQAPSGEKLNDTTTKDVLDVFPIGQTASGPAYLSGGRRIYTYTFTDKEEYENIAKNHLPNLSFDNMEGLAKYDDENQVLELSVDLSSDTLNGEAGGTFPTTYGPLRTYYIAKNYTCSLKTN